MACPKPGRRLGWACACLAAAGLRAADADGDPAGGGGGVHPLARVEVGETARYQVQGAARLQGRTARLGGYIEYTAGANTGGVAVITARVLLHALDDAGREAGTVADLETDVTVDLGEDLTPEGLAETYLRVLLAHDDGEAVEDLAVEEAPGETVILPAWDGGGDGDDGRMVGFEGAVECEAALVTAFTGQDGGRMRETLRLLAAPDGIPFLGIARFEVTVQAADGGELRYRADLAGYWPPPGEGAL